MNDPYIKLIHNDSDFAEFCDRAGIEPEHRDSAHELFARIGGLTVSNSATGEYCIAKSLPHNLRDQAK